MNGRSRETHLLVDLQGLTVITPPSPRLVDWTLFVLVGLLVGTGVLTILAGTQGDAWVFAIHTGAALLFPVFLGFKLWRVAHRLKPGELPQGVWTSIITGVLAFLALGTGIAWMVGAPIWIAGISWLVIHAVVGMALLLALAIHLRYRYRPLRGEDVSSRRPAIGATITALGGVMLWRVQITVISAFFEARRFTGSRERGSFAGTAMPVTMWAADDPEPVDLETWRLTVDGAVSTPQSLSYDEISDSDQLRATLDCTSGWYSVQDWAGIQVGDLLAEASVESHGRWVRFVSITGYRWSFPLDEAREYLLATHVGDDQLDHGHGRPLRLVAPGRRGFQWVKWVERVEVRRHPDPGQWVAIFTSGFG